MLLTTITTYLIILTIMTILRKFFKVDKSMLFCGIFAFSGKKDLSNEEKRTAFMKFKMLGLYNQSRGVHGTGIYINGEVIKNAGPNKLFNDFIANNVFEEMTDNHTLIGHCRQMSRGAQTEANTHPFKINDDLVGVHNGTIDNIWDLCKEAGIVRNFSETDSLALFEIIQKDGIDVLEKYKGGAALIWTRVEEDNVLYVFHGASKTYRAQTEPAVERPLFFLETSEGVYFSSLESSLLAVRNSDEDIVYELPTNVVYTLQDGEWLDEDATIDREEANVPATYVAPTTFHQQGHYPNQFSKQKEIFEGTGNSITRVHADYSIPTIYDNKLEPKIWRETRPSNAVNSDPTLSFVYFYKGRHYTNANVLARGKMNIAKGGFIHQQENKDTDVYFFFDGVMMKNEKAYDEVTKLLNMPNSVLYHPNTNFALVVSAYSKYPITNTPSEAGKIEPINRFKWYTNGFTAKEGFTPKFSPRHYKISLGVLTDVGSTESQDEIFFSNFSKAATESVKNVSDKAIVPFNVNTAQDKAVSIIPENNDVIFDIVYPDFDFLLRKIDKIRMLAMIKYVCKEREATHLDLDNEELHIEVSDKILMAVARKTTIRLILEDRYGLLEELMKEAQEEIEIEENSANIDFSKIESNPDFMEEREEKDLKDAYAYYQSHNNMDDEENDEDSVNEQSEIDDKLFEEEQKKEQELDEANDLMEDVIGLLTEINDKTDELQVLNNCDCAQEFASVLYKGLTNIKYNIEQVCQDQKNEEIQNLINKAINI